jgi:hypothetical protein
MAGLCCADKLIHHISLYPNRECNSHYTNPKLAWSLQTRCAVGTTINSRRFIELLCQEEIAKAAVAVQAQVETKAAAAALAVAAEIKAVATVRKLLERAVNLTAKSI